MKLQFIFKLNLQNCSNFVMLFHKAINSPPHKFFCLGSEPVSNFVHDSCSSKNGDPSMSFSVDQRSESQMTIDSS